MQHDYDWLGSTRSQVLAATSADAKSELLANMVVGLCTDYHEHMTAPLVERIAELEAALDKEHRESWAADLPYETHPLLVKE